MTAPHLELSIALSDNERTRPLLEGRVAPQGIKLVPTMVHPSEMFWRQLRFAEFDVSEMSMSSLIIATSRGDTRWVAIPVFTMRKFFYTSIIVRNDSGITTPAELRGKRLGVPEYQQTWAIWSRGILQHEFGVHARDIEWFMERNPDKSHGGATGFTAPPGVRVNQIPPTTNMGEMLLRGELDGALHYLVEKNLVDRSTVDVSGVTHYLFPDPAAEGRRFYAKTGLFPINHTVVVRRCAPGERIPGSRSTFIPPSSRRRRRSRATASPTCNGISKPGCSTATSSARSPTTIRWPTASRRRGRCSRPSRNTCTSRASPRAGSRSRKSSSPVRSTCDAIAMRIHLDPSP